MLNSKTFVPENLQVRAAGSCQAWLKRSNRLKTLYFSLTLIFFALPAEAQNTAGVFSPVVNAGHKSMQYRAVVDPDNNIGELGFAQRLHYQESVSDDLMWRLVGQTRKTQASDFDFDFVRAELFWDLGEDGQNYRTGFRFDLQVRDGNRPEQIGAHWTNQFYFNDGWSARAILLSSVQLGDNASDGVSLQTRWQLSKRLNSGDSLGVEMYNKYGYTGDFGSFDSQYHAVGPTYSKSFTSDWSIYSGILFGLSDNTADTEFRFRLIRAL